MGSVIDAINKRVSIRNYSSQPIEKEKIATLQEAIQSTSEGPFGNPVRIELIDLTETEKAEFKDLGTYGFINGAKYYMATAAKKTSHGMEDIGYCFEKIIG